MPDASACPWTKWSNGTHGTMVTGWVGCVREPSRCTTSDIKKILARLEGQDPDGIKVAVKKRHTQPQ